MVQVGEAGALCGSAISVRLLFFGCGFILSQYWEIRNTLRIFPGYHRISLTLFTLMKQSNYGAGSVAQLIEHLPHKLVQSLAQHKLGVKTHT